MGRQTFDFQAEDGLRIYGHKWVPADDGQAVRGVVQIAHGMAEHSGRYERFAVALNGRGFAVFANDHRGHGKTAGAVDNVGYFADTNGWNLVVNDMRQLTAVVREQYPQVPVFLLGHSMGSLLSRAYMIRHGSAVEGIILSATSGDPGVLGKLGLLIARLESTLRGARHRSRLLNAMSFGKFNQSFEPRRTDFDWLSRDDDEVDAYIADPYCGGVFTSGFFVDLLRGLAEINQPKNLAAIPATLPVYLVSGEKDPVGDDTRGVLSVAKALQNAAVDDVTYRFFSDARHEILNETNREEVFADIIAWIEKHMPAAHRQ